MGETTGGRTIAITLAGETRAVPLLPHPRGYPGGPAVITAEVFVDGFGRRCGMTLFPHGVEPDEPPIAASDGALYGAPPVLWPDFVPFSEVSIVGWAAPDLTPTD